MTNDPFEKYAPYSDLGADRSGHRKQFFAELIERHDIKTALDCACGTGNDILLLHDLGVNVCGSDISESMLAVAREKLAFKGLSEKLRIVDFYSLPDHYDTRFDAVLCMTTSLPQLRDEVKIVGGLVSMREVLNEGGVLILSQGMSDKLHNQKIRFVPTIATDELTRLMVIDYLETEWNVHVIDVVRTANGPEMRTNSFHYLTLLIDDYVRLLKEAGFAQIDTYGDFRFTEYDKDASDHIVVVARK